MSTFATNTATNAPTNQRIDPDPPPIENFELVLDGNAGIPDHVLLQHAAHDAQTHQPPRKRARDTAYASSRNIAILHQALLHIQTYQAQQQNHNLDNESEYEEENDEEYDSNAEQSGSYPDEDDF